MAKRDKIEVKDMDALEAFGKEKGYDNLVQVVTEKRENKQLLRKLVKHATGLKQTIPGVEVIAAVKDTRQTDLEKSIADKKAADDAATSNKAPVVVAKTTSANGKPGQKPVHQVKRA